MARLPRHWHELCPARLEEWSALGIDGSPFLVPDDVGLNSLAGDGPDIRKGVFVKKRDQSVKGLGPALMRRRREQQQVWRRLRKTLTEFVPGDLIRAAAEAVRLVHDHQVPAGGNQIFEALPVVLVRPTAPALQRLH